MGTLALVEEVRIGSVVAPDGRVRGLIDLKPETRISWLEGDRTWVVETDAFDIPWLVRYRLEDSAPR